MTYDIKEISATDDNVRLIFEGKCIDSSYSHEKLFLKKVTGTDFKNSIDGGMYIYIDDWVLIKPSTLKIKFVEAK